MRIITLFALLIITPLVWAAKKDQCNTILAKQSIKELAASYYEALAYGRDNKYLGGTNPKKTEIEATLNKMEKTVPNIRIMFSEELNNLTLGSQRLEITTDNSSSSEHRKNKLLSYIANLDGEPLEGESWHSFLRQTVSENDMYRRAYYIDIDVGSRVHFTTPPIVYKRPNRKPISSEVEQVLYLGSGYILFVPDRGPYHILELDTQAVTSKTQRQTQFREVNRFKHLPEEQWYNKYANIEYNHYRVLSDNQFIAYTGYDHRAYLWQWNPNGDVYIKKEFGHPSLLVKYSRRARKFAGAYIDESLFITTYQESVYLWDTSGESAEAILLDYRDSIKKAEIENIVQIDESSFIAIHHDNQLEKWVVVTESFGKKRLKSLGLINENHGNGVFNYDLKSGHFISQSNESGVNGAAMISENLLLTAGRDGRLILWDITKPKDKNIVQTFPIKQPKIEDDKIVGSENELHLEPIWKFRWKIIDGKLWVESWSRNQRIVWQPIDVLSGGEL